MRVLFDCTVQCVIMSAFLHRFFGHRAWSCSRPVTFAIAMISTLVREGQITFFSWGIVHLSPFLSILANTKLKNVSSTCLYFLVYLQIRDFKMCSILFFPWFQAGQRGPCWWGSKVRRASHPFKKLGTPDFNFIVSPCPPLLACTSSQVL